jgi:phosphoenolpyruvate carboxykinase (GTP)
MTEAPEGVPISAVLFGGRRRKVAPLVYEARDWRHGVLVGAGMASETTAAAVGKVGVVRRDPMAMKPFCGYNFGDYWGHWLGVGERLRTPPRVFHVNWFRQDDDGRFLWPGFGDNLHVLHWIVDRCAGRVGARETAIGFLPEVRDLDVQGLAIGGDALGQLLEIDPAAWRVEMDAIADYLAEFGDRLPSALATEQRRIRAALG